VNARFRRCNTNALFGEATEKRIYCEFNLHTKVHHYKMTISKRPFTKNDHGEVMEMHYYGGAQGKQLPQLSDVMGMQISQISQ
jgi:hypothetical protein